VILGRLFGFEKKSHASSIEIGIVCFALIVKIFIAIIVRVN
jgi:hypothetical protein